MRYFWMATWLGLSMASSVHGAEILLSGFGSFVGGISNNDKNVTFTDYDTEDLNFKVDSLAGLQVSAQVTEKASATMQFVARGNQDWATEVDWAYVRYQPRTDFSWKLGRLNIPFYLYSDFITVGYSYPWIVPPNNVYNLPFSNVDGGDFVYTFAIRDFDIQLQGYLGSSSFVPKRGVFVGMETETRNQFGLSAEVSWNAWKFRYAYHGADAYVDTTATAEGQFIENLANALRQEGYNDVADDLLIENDYSSFHDLAFSFEEGRYLAVAEAVEISTHDSTPAPVHKAYYLTGGILQDTVLYYTTFGVIDGKAPKLAGDLPAASPSYALVKIVENAAIEDSLALTLGFRWDFVENLAFKTEVSKLRDKKRHKEFNDDELDMVLVRFGIHAIF